MVSRQKLLEAAMRVFAESGYRGATTRRIAEAAGVNEVTLFRQFKSKTALIDEAAKLYARQRAEHALPAVPLVSLDELSAWCTAQLKFLRASRALIRKCMAEVDEHPQMAGCMRAGPDVAQLQLRAYADELVRQRGLRIDPDEVRLACMMLQGALFADAMGRDIMPDLYPRPLQRAGEMYARAFLRLLGAESPAGTAPHEGHELTPAANGASSTRARRTRSRQRPGSPNGT
jgi:AcrR family transcriptional regulator